MSITIRAYTEADRAPVTDLSIRAWGPVFPALRPAVPQFVYDAFYPAGWEARQTEDIVSFLDEESDRVLIAEADGQVVGWLGFRLHPVDQMGEIYILAVDPRAQRAGIASALMQDASQRMRDAGMIMVMVETGDDPGHASARALYENAGFSRWPVARYFRPL